jgi:hypothetical protein
MLCLLIMIPIEDIELGFAFAALAIVSSSINQFRENT